MHISTLLYSLLTLAIISKSFKFAGPSTSTPLGLSKEIVITWIQSNSSENKTEPTFHLEGFSHSTDLESFGFKIDTDMKVSAGQYKFTPSSNAINTLRLFAEQLSEIKFKASFRNESDERDVIYEAYNGEYSVIGLDKVINAGKAVRLDWGLAVASLFMI